MFFNFSFKLFKYSGIFALIFLFFFHINPLILQLKDISKIESLNKDIELYYNSSIENKEQFIINKEIEINNLGANIRSRQDNNWIFDIPRIINEGTEK